MIDNFLISIDLDKLYSIHGCSSIQVVILCICIDVDVIDVHDVRDSPLTFHGSRVGICGSARMAPDSILFLCDGLYSVLCLYPVLFLYT